MSLPKLGAIECKFFEHESNGYTCEVESFETHKIRSVTGMHLPGKSNKDVEFLSAKSKTLQHLPENLSQIFPKLEHISIESAEFREILQTDLEPFGDNLRTLSLTKTKLESLPADLFKANEMVGHLYIESDVFKHINKSMFDAIPRLYFLGVKFPGFSSQAFNDAKIKNTISNLDIRVFVKDFEHKLLDRKQILEKEKSEEKPVAPPRTLTPKVTDPTPDPTPDQPTITQPNPVKPTPLPRKSSSNSENEEPSNQDDTSNPEDPIIRPSAPPREEPASRGPCGWLTAIIGMIVAGIGGLFGFLFMRKSNSERKDE
jgi:hypothetical protein